MKTKKKYKDPEKDQPNYAVKYAGIGFQMLAIILIGVFGGIYLDKWLHTKNIFTLILSLISVVAAIFVAIKDFIIPPKK